MNFLLQICDSFSIVKVCLSEFRNKSKKQPLLLAVQHSLMALHMKFASAKDQLKDLVFFFFTVTAFASMQRIF